ncbi:MAG: flagellar type III secretion system pore protein FliP [Clostridiales bacterium]|nr:flagellar type III secretion system pore protein FliP [Clostridiales bacterium]
MRSKVLFAALCVVFLFLLNIQPVYASNPLLPEISLSVGGTDDPADLVPALQVLFMVSIIALAPSLLMLLTGFTRIVISMHFLRAAMGTQQMPPNQVLVGVALVLTLYLMAPQLTAINETALQPLGRGEITIDEAIARGIEPLSRFMRSQVEDRDVDLFCKLQGVTFETREEVPDSIIVPAFILGELTKGFIIGFVLYLPFIVIDMVVASVLMAMGMMMLPPAMISMPFKILLFLLAGGWGFFIEHVMATFQGVVM